MIESGIRLPDSSVVPATFLVGPANDGRYYYGFPSVLGWTVSQHGYHNAPSAAFDARRIQRVNAEGFLVPDGRFNPDLN